MDAPSELPALNRRAVALVSGGLDSMLAGMLVARQGVELTGICFATDFGCGSGSGGGCGADPRGLALGFPLIYSHLGDVYTRIVREPAHGYGKQMNPCIDCRMLMLSEAWRYAVASGASWLVTGEVVSQRPLSQPRETMMRVERKLGLAGRVLRPLSARLLEPTAMERAGLVDREGLRGFHGRDRNPQLALARELGVEELPAVAGGGCLLTSEGYARRVKDLFHFAPADRLPHAAEIRLLRHGRNYRLDGQRKFIIGRDAADNAALAQHARPDADWLLVPEGGKGASAVLIAEQADAEALRFVAQAAASYHKARPGEPVSYRLSGPPLAAVGETLEVQAPADRDAFRELLV